MDGVGSGVAASLRAVDCAAGSMAETAFGRLFGSEGALVPALTALLTLYVAFFALALLTGRTRLGLAALTPRMITVGLVLTFATSWIAYQSLVWNLAVGGPDQLAALLTGVDGSATQVFADKIDIVFKALVDSTGSAPGTDSAATFSPPGLLWLGGTLLLLGTAGVLATSKIALAILLGLGPVFVVLALFPATRGLFAGWLKGVVLLAITPLFAVLGGSLMLDLSVPVLRALAEHPGAIDARAAMAFFMIGAVHVALMIMVLKVAGTIVAGWNVFGARRGEDGEGTARAAAAAVRAAAPPVPLLRPEPARAAAPAPSREVRLARTALVAANDGAVTAGPARRETRVLPAAAAAGASPSRTRGLGSRFRSAPLRSTEKFR
ncbi:MAG TPA: type IV secretion system protein [Croceibacterium sp.]|nr:type IV secretion system protein [Croceibacterium sp.]